MRNMFPFVDVIMWATWINFNLNLHISNYIHYKVWDEITYSIPKLQQLHRWSLGMDK